MFKYPIKVLLSSQTHRGPLYEQNNFAKHLMFCRRPERLVGNQLNLLEGGVRVALVDTVIHQLTTNGIGRATCDNTAEVTHQMTMLSITLISSCSRRSAF